MAQPGDEEDMAKYAGWAGKLAWPAVGCSVVFGAIVSGFGLFKSSSDDTSFFAAFVVTFVGWLVLVGVEVLIVVVAMHGQEEGEYRWLTFKRCYIFAGWIFGYFVGIVILLAFWAFKGKFSGGDSAMLGWILLVVQALGAAPCIALVVFFLMYERERAQQADADGDDEASQSLQGGHSHKHKHKTHNTHGKGKKSKKGKKGDEDGAEDELQSDGGSQAGYGDENDPDAQASRGKYSDEDADGGGGDVGEDGASEQYDGDEAAGSSSRRRSHRGDAGYGDGDAYSDDAGGADYAQDEAGNSADEYGAAQASRRDGRSARRGAGGEQYNDGYDDLSASRQRSGGRDAGAGGEWQNGDAGYRDEDGQPSRYGGRDGYGRGGPSSSCDEGAPYRPSSAQSGPRRSSSGYGPTNSYRPSSAASSAYYDSSGRPVYPGGSPSSAPSGFPSRPPSASANLISVEVESGAAPGFSMRTYWDPDRSQYVSR